MKLKTIKPENLKIGQKVVVLLLDKNGITKAKNVQLMYPVSSNSWFVQNKDSWTGFFHEKKIYEEV